MCVVRLSGDLGAIRFAIPDEVIEITRLRNCFEKTIRADSRRGCRIKSALKSPLAVRFRTEKNIKFILFRLRRFMIQWGRLAISNDSWIWRQFFLKPKQLLFIQAAFLEMKSAFPRTKKQILDQWARRTVFFCRTTGWEMKITNFLQQSRGRHEKVIF